MKYDFQTVTNRINTGSMKWDQMLLDNPELEEDIIPLSVADMEFKNPPEIKEGLKNYIDEMILGYTGPTESYYDAVIHWMEKRHQYKVEKEWIVQTPGVVNAFFNAVRNFSEEGDGIIVMGPVYYPFYLSAEKNNRKIVNCPLLEDKGYYTMDFEKIEQAAQRKENKILLFCSPHNPVGRVWTREELEQLSKIILRNDLLVVSDEIHSDLIMPGYKHLVLQNIDPRLQDRIITCTAPSKTFNLAGLGISNIIIPNEEIRNRFKEGLVETATFNTMMGFKACETAYNECEEWLEECIEVIDGNQRYVKKFFEENFPKIKAPLVEGTYLQWVDFRALDLGNEELEELMTKEAKLYLDEGYIFGAEGSGFERFNLACPKSVIEQALERLKKVIEKKL